MKVSDAMSREVVTVSPETSLKDAAAVLAERRVSGLPVVSEGKVAGVISEADIVARSVGRQGRSGLLEALFGDRRGEEGGGETLVGDAMSSPAVTVEPGATVAEAARTMIERQVNRLPVVDDSGIVGILTRADVVNAFVRPDEEIEREIRQDVAQDALWIDPSGLQVTVEDGVVTLGGEVERRTDAVLLEKFAAAVPGVVSLRSDLRWRLDEPELPAGNPRVPIPPRH